MNLAAQAGVRYSIENPLAYVNTNILGLNIAADLNSIKLEPWLDFIEEIQSGSKETASNEDAVEGGILKQVQLNLGYLRALDQDFPKTNVTLKNKAGIWSADLDGPSIKGVVLPAYNDETLSLKFDHLFLTSSTTTSAKDSASITPENIPVLEFATQKLVINDHDYGAWSTTTERIGDGIIFRKIKGKVADSTIKGQLNWQLYAEGHHNSILTLDTKGETIEGLLTAFDIEPLMTSKRFSSALAFVWPDTPLDFSFEYLFIDLIGKKDSQSATVR